MLDLTSYVPLLLLHSSNNDQNIFELLSDQTCVLSGIALSPSSDSALPIFEPQVSTTSAPDQYFIVYPM